MEMSPAQITEATFRTVRKGYDPAEVDAFLADVAKALEEARQHSTAMEARARAAVARLQEASTSPAAEPATPPATEVAPVSPAAPADQVRVPAAEAETISRTLLLAQTTADSTIAEARAEADRIVSDATNEAETTIDSTREMSARMLEDARSEARRASEAELLAAENDVEALVARREFLVGDVDQLERFLIDQRDRLRGAARQIEALCERVPEGLGSVRPPALSASDDDDPGDPTQELTLPEGEQGDSGPGESGHGEGGHSGDDDGGDPTVAAPAPPMPGEPPAGGPTPGH